MELVLKEKRLNGSLTGIKANLLLKLGKDWSNDNGD